MKSKKRFGQDWLNLLLGVWLFLSPIFGFGEASQAASLNAGLFGMFIATLALFALFRPRPWQEWTNLAFGVWLVLAPTALNFSEMTQATWNHVLVGASVSILASWAVARRYRRREAT